MLTYRGQDCLEIWEEGCYFALEKLLNLVMTLDQWNYKIKYNILTFYNYDSKNFIC